MPNPSSDIAAEATTILSLSGVGVPPYSARGLTQTLTPIGMATKTRRTINGSLKNLSVSQLQKYVSEISGTDQDPPSMGTNLIGKTIIVDCISEICVLTGNVFGRESISSRIEGDFTFYRPRLSMKITNFSQNKDENGATAAWKISLEEDIVYRTVVAALRITVDMDTRITVDGSRRVYLWQIKQLLI
jgi:hypothetical protein